jgi:hypothetical protein
MQFIQLRRNGSVMSAKQVTVDIKHHTHRRVAEPGGNALGVHASGDQPGNMGMVGSDRGAVRAFRLVRFLGPPAEPDVRVPTHPALHETMPFG